MGKLYRAEVTVVAYIVVEDEDEFDEDSAIEALVEELNQKHLPDYSQEITDPEHKPDWNPGCFCYDNMGGPGDITIREAMEEVRARHPTGD